MRLNKQLVERARRLVGPEGNIMLDCWMGLTEAYAEKLAARLEPYRVYWIEECLMPDDYAGMRRLNAKIQSTRCDRNVVNMGHCCSECFQAKPN